ncbi:MAG TPA: cysteine--tRNA ligase, partial [Pseudomonadales bacterium]|nr:cysteine--tRNA ligase [Pseudomonadales bacterium]
APLPAAELAQSAYAARFREAMDDDFNTPGALALMHEIARELNTAAREGDAARARALAAQLRGFGAILGILGDDPLAFRRGGGGDASEDAGIDALVAERVQAKKAKDFARADAIREELRQRGIVIEDTREGSVWRRETV